MNGLESVSLLRRLWLGWVRFGHWLGDVMSWVWMPLFYFVIALPFALGVKLFSDPLGLRRRGSAAIEQAAAEKAAGEINPDLLTPRVHPRLRD